MYAVICGFTRFTMFGEAVLTYKGVCLMRFLATQVHKSWQDNKKNPTCGTSFWEEDFRINVCSPSGVLLWPLMASNYHVFCTATAKRAFPPPPLANPPNLLRKKLILFLALHSLCAPKLSQTPVCFPSSVEWGWGSTVELTLYGWPNRKKEKWQWGQHSHRLTHSCWHVSCLA